MIYVTHDQVEAMTLADKIVVLRGGVVEQTGSPIGLYSDPDNVFVGGFIGSPRMNFLKATAGNSKGSTLDISLDDFAGVKFKKKLEGAMPKAGSKLLVGIRPEHFEKTGKVKIKSRIDVVENLGGTAFAYSRADAAEPLTIQLSDGSSCKEGAVYQTGFNADRCFVFDGKTELRLR